MPLVIADRVKETSTTTGTGTITLAGASAGFQSFAAVGNGNQTFYTIADQSGTDWEVGIGTYTASGTTLSRDTILASSNSGSAVNFSAGTKDVFVTYPAARASVGTAGLSINTNQTSISQNTTLDSGFNASSVGPITIPSGVNVTVPTGQSWLIFG
jgi:hypothetical protein